MRTPGLCILNCLPFDPLTPAEELAVSLWQGTEFGDKAAKWRVTAGYLRGAALYAQRQDDRGGAELLASAAELAWARYHLIEDNHHEQSV